MRTVIDKQRGCGWRKPGGIYLMSEGLMASCGRLPLDLEKCPCCGAGVKATRGWTWVNAKLLFKNRPCETVPTGTRARRPSKKEACLLCPLNNPPTQAGLLWIGGSFYQKPGDWIDEARVQGVSRRISTVPKGLEVGKTLILVAHRRHHLAHDQKTWVPAIFHAFTPSRLEYVVRGNETPSEIDRLVKRGIEPVKVVREGHLGDIDAQAELETAKTRSAEQAKVGDK